MQARLFLVNLKLSETAFCCLVFSSRVTTSVVLRKASLEGAGLHIAPFVACRGH